MIALAVSGDWWSRHGAHALIIGVPVVFLGGVALWSDVRASLSRRRERGQERSDANVALPLAALLSLGAALVHSAVCPEHFREATIYGLFFLVAAGGQVAWAALALKRPSRLLLYGGVAGNVAFIALWAVTRTQGIPLGPGRDQAESIGTLDLIATSCEIGIVVCALLAARTLSRRLAPVAATVR